MPVHATDSGPAAEETVVTKAALAAAERLGLNARTLAGIIGVSEATLSRIRKGTATLDKTGKPYELALMFIRVFRSLDAITGGDETVARAWLRSENSMLGGTPLEKIVTISGLSDVLAYLDARRAQI